MITSALLSALAKLYESEDDVWNAACLGGALAMEGPQGAVLDASVGAWIASYGAQYLLTSSALNITVLESTEVTTIIYSVYRDNYEAFLFGVIPVFGSTASEAASLFISRYQDDRVPVPSRLYCSGDPRPLAGMRISIKDIYDLEGVQTGAGSRSSAEFVDIHYPFNPRGDWWLSAASSSSGPVCAIAGYDWIDIALGSDTRGPVRKPASAVGSYGTRPTWNSRDLTGVTPLATELDTVGFFARDPNLSYKVQRLWYDDSLVLVNKSFASFPKKLLYPGDYFPVNSSAGTGPLR
ncbi:amidase signature domain-containing protein [Xylariaceae sp. FL1272]|nr:amidase signature domain-containing protein [Xylariaceae sp. FL1272]